MQNAKAKAESDVVDLEYEYTWLPRKRRLEMFSASFGLPVLNLHHLTRESRPYDFPSWLW